MRHTVVLFTGIVAAAVSASYAEATIWITNDRGGTILEYAERFRQLRASGERVVIDGNCRSACTMVIGLLPRGQVCATPRAVFGFHAAFRRTSDGGTVASTDATKFMMDSYPPEVRKWISQRGGLTAQMIFLTGSELATFVPTCGSTAGSSVGVGTWEASSVSPGDAGPAPSKSRTMSTHAKFSDPESDRPEFKSRAR